MRAQTKRPVRVDLVDEYEGWYATIDGNFTVGQLRDLASGELDRVARALGTMLLGWNFVDKNGEPLEIGDVDGLSIDLLRALTEATSGATAVPNR